MPINNLGSQWSSLIPSASNRNDMTRERRERGYGVERIRNDHHFLLHHIVGGRVPFHSLLFPLATRTRPHHIFPFPFLCGDNGFWFYFLFESFYLTKPIIIIYFSFPILRLWSLSLPPNNLRERDLIITARLRLTEELRDEAWSGESWKGLHWA